MELPAKTTPPATKRHRTALTEYREALAYAAMHNPPEHAWLPWPTPITGHTPYSYASRIKRGQILGAGYTACVRNRTLYVRKETQQ